MKNILKPYTIIPPDLYVQRDADRQLKNIIEDMGRPGYVLVSRQMGKTNLLLNAKRNLESPNDIFVYIDLSNPFDNAKSCFENIIDTAIETNTDKFESVSKLVLDRRMEIRDTPPHKQHTSELRLLLNAIEGKLVIILDEIDALTKTTYSDQIFAQIRSIYFSRVNFKELERLTYILSGVIEPTEIIKDPKISPFNIGQKIFLNDFSREEFEQFLNNSNLRIQTEIVDRIFYWTHGNPRMTWDVCSEVENRVINANFKSQELTNETIDNVIGELYLTTFDKPPIDNIRELVKKDREIRNSIVEIEYNKGKEVSDKIKNKLYLSGIINYNENTISIKNNIIKKSLNIDWIKSLEEEERGLLRVCIDYFEKQKFEEAIATFDKFKNEADQNTEDLSYYHHIIGVANFKLGRFLKALEFFNVALFDIEDQAKLYYSNLNYKGTSYFNIENIDESLNCLRQVINSGRKDVEYARALINYGLTLLKSSKKSELDEAVTIFQGIIDETSFKKEKLHTDLITEMKSIANFNLAGIQRHYGNIDDAIRCYKRAIDLSEEKKKPKIIFELLHILKTEDEIVTLLEGLIEQITQGTLSPIENDQEDPLAFSLDVFSKVIIFSFIKYKSTLFQKLIPHLPLLGAKKYSRHIYDLAIFSININNDFESGCKLLEELLKNNDVDPEIEFYSVKILAYNSIKTGISETCFKYLKLFEIGPRYEIDMLDMDIFSSTIYSLTKLKRYSEALNYANLIKSVRQLVSEEVSLNYIVVYHLELNLYLYMYDDANSIKKAREIIKLIDQENVKTKSINLLGKNALETIKQNAEDVLSNTSFKDTRTLTRNDKVTVRYKNGTTILAKFKKVEKDLSSGVCVIIG